MDEHAIGTLVRALDELADESTSTRPVSVSLLGPLIDALQSLVEDEVFGRPPSRSAVSLRRDR